MSGKDASHGWPQLQSDDNRFWFDIQSLYSQEAVLGLSIHWGCEESINCLFLFKSDLVIIIHLSLKASIHLILPPIPEPPFINPFHIKLTIGWAGIGTDVLKLDNLEGVTITTITTKRGKKDINATAILWTIFGCC